jgi:oxygen-independent coproporphyrinogen-3 oxidase
MAGIYVHIPFCKTRCVYCDFYSRAVRVESGGVIAAYVDALCRELRERRTYLCRPVETLYFGGGTPSILSVKDFTQIFDTLAVAFPGIAPSEVTLEANPDDLSPEYLDSIKSFPFNRISLGIQSLDDAELRFLNRRHTASAAIQAVDLCRKKGFDNVSIDLIYGIPGQTPEGWRSTLRRALKLPIAHLSAYHLTYEEGTPLFRLLQQKRIRPLDEEASAVLFEILLDEATSAGFQHYEISNFARPAARRSKHNSGYWNGAHYLGVGASAHSYNGTSRQWNPQSYDPNYQSLGVEIEILDEKTRFNDFIITRLRTVQGIDLRELAALFGNEKRACCIQQAQKYIDGQLLEVADHHLRLTRKAFFISDGIATDLLL